MSDGQGDLFTAAPVVNPQEVSSVGVPQLGKVAPSKNKTARECSLEGAEAVGPRIEAQQERLLGAYRLMGDLTDQEMADFLGLDRSSVIPRRTELIKAGRVQERDRKRKNPKTGIGNALYGLTK